MLLSILTTDQKGAIAETAITLEALKLGVGVSRPLCDERYDLIFDVEERLLRVQCKWACRYGGVVIVRCYSCRRTSDGLRRRVYRHDEVDAFAAYCPDVDQCYFLPIECSRRVAAFNCGSRRRATTKRWAYAGLARTSSPLNWGGSKGP
jgi:hypothetical protein